jgi:hypothetical protein
MRALLEAIACHAILPSALRCQLSRTFRSEVQAASRAFREFEAGVSNPLEDAWARAASVPEHATTTSSTILDERKLDLLHCMVLGEKSLTEHAGDALRFRGVTDARATGYSECRTLGDHYLAGAGTLLERIGDYAEELAGPIGRMNVLDILELGGREEAHSRVAEALDMARRSLRLAPGLLPLVEEKQALNAVYVIRLASGLAAAFARDYAALVGSKDLVLESEDPNVLDVTSLVFGFPAFLVQALHEGRAASRARAGGGGLASDLWPDTRSQ